MQRCHQQHPECVSVVIHFLQNIKFAWYFRAVLQLVKAFLLVSIQCNQLTSLLHLYLLYQVRKETIKLNDVDYCKFETTLRALQHLYTFKCHFSSSYYYNLLTGTWPSSTPWNHASLPPLQRWWLPWFGWLQSVWLSLSATTAWRDFITPGPYVWWTGPETMEENIN